MAIPTLETERLRLRSLRGSDLDDYAALYADPEVVRHLGGGGQPWDRGRAWRHLAFVRGHWLLAGTGSWAVELTESGAFLGVSVTDGQNGALVQDVDASAPAGRAGIQQGDEIVSLGGQSVQSADDLTSAMRSHKPGDKVTVTFLRGQSRQSVDVQLVSRQASS